MIKFSSKFLLFLCYLTIQLIILNNCVKGRLEILKEEINKNYKEIHKINQKSTLKGLRVEKFM